MELIQEKIHPHVQRLAARDAGYAIRAREAALSEFQRVHVTSDGNVPAATAAAVKVLEGFEAGLETHLAEVVRHRREEFEREQRQSSEFARSRALAEARRNSMTVPQILGEAQKAGMEIELRDGVLCARGTLSIELTAHVQLQRDAIVEFLEQAWTPIPRW